MDTCLAFEFANDATHADRLWRGSNTYALCANCARDGVGTRPASLAESEIVIRAHVNQSLSATSELEIPIVIVGLALEQSELGACSTRHRTIH